MEQKKYIQWHSILQNIFDNYMDLLSGKNISKGEREDSRYIKIDYYVEAGGNLPTEKLKKNIVRPFDHIKGKNVIEYKSWHESLNEDVFRHYIMRALAVESPQKGISYRGDVTLTILTTHKPELFFIDYYKFERINKWKYRSLFFKDLEIYVLVQREMRDERAGEALALLQVLEGDPEKQKSIWLNLFSQDLDNAPVLKNIAEQISKEKIMTLVEEIRQKGKTEGKIEGKIEGEIEARKEIVEKMLKRNMEIALISELTKLSQEEILEIKKIISN